MKNFWVILGAVVLVMIGLFFATKKKAEAPVAKVDGDIQKVLKDDHVRGKRDAKVVLIEYGDFQCPGCGGIYPVLKQVEAEYGDRVAFVFRHLPLTQIHPNALSAARAAEAASQQGKFFEMHDLLYENQQTWGQASTNQQKLFEGYAEQLMLDMNKFRSAYASAEVSNRINRDVATADTFKVTGTPAFFLQGEKVETPTDGKAGFAKLLDAALKKAGVEKADQTEPAAQPETAPAQ